MRGMPLLTISILCSGRRETKKCLDSLKVLREKVPSELILVDTGCDEKMKKFLHHYTEKIIPFVWCNDFAKARNAGLEKAQGVWFMFLDDDEWFLDTKEIEEFFLSGEFEKCGSASYIVRNYLDQNGFTYEDSEPIRLVRLQDEVRFEGIIHERLTPAPEPKKRLRSIAEHYGYVFRTEEEEKKHAERNLTLLLKALKEDEGNTQIWVHLVQQYRSGGNYRVLQEFCRRALRKFEDGNSREINRDRGCFYCGLIEADVGLKDYKTAEADYESALADERNTDCCIARLMTFGAEIFSNMGKEELVKECCQRYFVLFRYFKTRQKELDEQDTFSVRQAFHQIMRNNMYSYQICLDLERGNIAALRKYFDDFNWDSGKVYMTEQFMPCLVKAMAQFPYEEIFVHAADVLANKPGMDNFWEEVEKMEDEAEVRQIVRILSEVTGGLTGEAAIKLKEMLQAEEKDDWQTFGKELKKAVESSPRLSGILKRYAGLYAERRIKGTEEENAVKNADRHGGAERVTGEAGTDSEQSVSDEMLTLAAQIKGQIRALLSQGMRREAMQVLNQLKTFVPEDEELLELDNEIRGSEEYYG